MYYRDAGLLDKWVEAHPTDLQKVAMTNPGLEVYPPSTFRDDLAIAMAKTNKYPWRCYVVYTTHGYQLKTRYPRVFEAFVEICPPLHMIPDGMLDEVITDIIYERLIRRH